MKKRSFTWFLRLLFYVFLDAVIGAIIYIISIDEADLAPGQLAIRILTAMTLVSAIVGGPDIMLYWQESGRRIAAEQRLEAAEQERDEVQAKLAERDRQIDELHARIQRLEAEQSSRQRHRRSRRRHLRRQNGDT
ncbi:MAG: hypothetical protein OXL37_17280 [Chloroflexota bacterium]|nr:hypothetical protein [Chloroflexota bacterium]MDE2960914.1 hypothetical protein [Chloroflexota bacterium]